METSGRREQRSDACLVLEVKRPPLGSPRATRALPLPAARGRGRSRRREEGNAEKGQPGGRGGGGGGAAPLPARLCPRVQAGRSAPPPACSRPPAAARSRHCSRSSPARWVSSRRPGAHRRGAGDQPAPGPPRPQQRPLVAPGGPGFSTPGRAAPVPVGSRIPAASRPALSSRRLPPRAGCRPSGEPEASPRPGSASKRATARNFGTRDAGPPPACRPRAPHRPRGPGMAPGLRWPLGLPAGLTVMP